MNDTPNPPESEHAWVHDNLAAYLAGGLDPAERARLDAHINACPDCFDAFTDARDADRTLQRMLGGREGAATLVPDDQFEQRLLTTFREKTMKSRRYLFVRRTGYAAAAMLALAATGAFAHYAIRQGGVLSNPLSDRLVAQAHEIDPAFGDQFQNLAKKLSITTFASQAAATASDDAKRYRANVTDVRDVDGLQSQPGSLNATKDLANAQMGQLRSSLVKTEISSGDGHAEFARAPQVGMFSDSIYTPSETHQRDPSFSYGNSPSDQQKKGMEIANGNISGSGAIVKEGAGTLQLNGQNGYVGQTVISGGKLDDKAINAPQPNAPKLDGWVNQTSAAAQKDIQDRVRRGTGIGNDDIGFEFGAANLKVKNAGIQAGSDFPITPGGAGKPASGPPAGGGRGGRGGGAAGGSGGGGFGGGAGGSPGSYDVITVPVAGDGTDREAKAISSSDTDGITAGKKDGLDSSLKQSPALLADTSGDTAHFRSSSAPVQVAAAPATAPAFTTRQSQSIATTQAAASQPSAAEVAERKIIRNGTVEFEVRSFEDTYATVLNVVTEEGGFVSSTTSDKLANGKVRGNIAVRVPPDHLDRFLMKIRALGELKSQQIGATDVTKEFTDVDSELRGLRVMEGRLIDLIKNGKGEVKDLVEAERQLGEYRVRIEKLEGTIRYYNNLVGMATLNITAYEKDIQKPTSAFEQENVNVSVETEEVEAKYLAARKILDDAKARIVDSQLKNTDADHIAASITADVPPGQADFVAAQLKQLGKIAAFTRDRHQTTTGGTGVPNVEVEQKDTRFTLSLYNLANLAPRETTVLAVAVRDVDEAYATILRQVRQTTPPAAGAAADGNKEPRAAGRIVSSALNGQLADQKTADVTAQVRSDQADALIQQIRATGEVLVSNLVVNADTAQTTAAKREVRLHLVNIAAVPARETVTLTVAVRDVEAAAARVRTLVERAPAATGPARGPAAGRIQVITFNGQQGDDMTAQVRAEIPATAGFDSSTDPVIQAVRDAGFGEVLTSVATQSPDTLNTTPSKRAIQLTLVNVAAVPPRERQNLSMVAADVQASYRKILDALDRLVTAGDARIITQQLNQSDPRTITASLQFEVRRTQKDAVDKIFADAGVDPVTRTETHAASTANTLDSKILFQVDQIRAAESLAPRRTFTISREVENVDRAIDDLRSAAGGLPVREADFNKQIANGRVAAHIVFDAPTANTGTMIGAVAHLGGVEHDNQVTKNAQVPQTRFDKDRIEINLISKATLQPIVPSDKGFGPTVHAALSSSAAALLTSMYLVLTGLLFVLPFMLIAWPVWAIIRRRRRTTAESTT